MFEPGYAHARADDLQALHRRVLAPAPAEPVLEGVNEPLHPALDLPLQLVVNRDREHQNLEKRTAFEGKLACSATDVLPFDLAQMWLEKRESARRSRELDKKVR